MELFRDFRDIRASDEIGEMAIALMKSSQNATELELGAAELATSFCLKDFGPKPEPPTIQPLEDLQKYQQSDEYKALSAKDKRHRKSLIYRREDVQEHLKHCSNIRRQNISNVRYLEELLEIWLWFDDKDRFKKVWDVYNEYPNYLVDRYDEVVWRKRLNWGKGVSRQLTEKAKNVFGGEVV